MRVIGRIVVLVVLVGAAAGGWYWWSQRTTQPSNELVVYGNIDIRQVELAINGSDRIEKVLVEEGDRIAKGQLLANLDTERLTLAVDRGQALVETQAQVVARLEAGSRPEEIAKAKADVEAQRAVAKDSNRIYERMTQLRRQNQVTQQELDNALADFESAEAKAKSLQAVLDLAIAGPRIEDKAEAKAVLKQYEVALAQAKHDLKEAYLYAPNDGIVQDRILEVGDMASPQKAIYTVALVDPLWVRAYVSEPDLGKIFEGMQASVTTDSFPGKAFEGWVGFISPTAEFTPKPVETRELRTKLVYQVRVFVKNPNNQLRLGMPATVTIPLDQQRRREARSGSNAGEPRTSGAAK